MKTQASEIRINSVTRETEKAICINVPVSWGEGSWKVKDVWFPKSTCEIITVNGEQHALVADWIIEKTAQQNAFHGYVMNFCSCFNGRYSD